MHGVIVNQLRLFVVSTHGRDLWNRMRADSQVEIAAVPAIDRTYDDADVLALVRAAATASDVDLQDLLEQFGVFLAPALLRIYEPLLQPEWRTLDVIERTEERIHRVVRRQDDKAAPRHRAVVARGIMHGLATHFHERLDIEEPTCMLRGDAACLLVGRLQSPSRRTDDPHA
jgi:hypothetical protein